MTGELTLSGTVLPVGGITAKVLAAYRQGIKRIIMWVPAWYHPCFCILGVALVRAFGRLLGCTNLVLL